MESKVTEEEIIKRIMWALILGCLALTQVGRAHHFPPCLIVQKPIQFNQQRIAQTKDYIKKHYGINFPSIYIHPRMIVIHWTDSKKLNASFNVFNDTMIKDRSRIKQESPLNLSVHYLIDRNGTIYQLMPTNIMARHVIGLNYLAIGIENVGGENDRDDLTQAQFKANLCLIRLLKTTYPRIRYLIGHHEYLSFKHTPLWKEKNPNYLTKKYDPGKRFMRALREQVQDLNFEAVPARSRKNRFDLPQNKDEHA